MPIGIIVDSLCVVIGGVIGALAGSRLSANLKDALNMVFGVCSMSMGMVTIVLMESMPAVILSIILGTAIGVTIHLGDKINAAGEAMQRFMSRFIKNTNTSMSDEEFTATLVTIIVLFCASGTGIYGSIVSGMSGDHSIIIAKAVLDLPTALIFACTLGMVVSVIAVPQFVIFLILFIFAGIIYPLTTPAMVSDFKACGGIIMVATGFRMIKVKMFPTADMIPAMIIVMPISWVWATYIAPLL